MGTTKGTKPKLGTKEEKKSSLASRVRAKQKLLYGRRRLYKHNFHKAKAREFMARVKAKHNGLDPIQTKNMPARPKRHFTRPMFANCAHRLRLFWMFGRRPRNKKTRYVKPGPKRRMNPFFYYRKCIEKYIPPRGSIKSAQQRDQSVRVAKLWRATDEPGQLWWRHFPSLGAQRTFKQKHPGYKYRPRSKAQIAADKQKDKEDKEESKRMTQVMKKLRRQYPKGIPPELDPSLKAKPEEPVDPVPKRNYRRPVFPRFAPAFAGMPGPMFQYILQCPIPVKLEENLPQPEAPPKHKHKHRKITKKQRRKEDANRAAWRRSGVMGPNEFLETEGPVQGPVEENGTPPKRTDKHRVVRVVSKKAKRHSDVKVSDNHSKSEDGKDTKGKDKPKRKDKAKKQKPPNTLVNVKPQDPETASASLQVKIEAMEAVMPLSPRPTRDFSFSQDVTRLERVAEGPVPTSAESLLSPSMPKPVEEGPRKPVPSDPSTTPPAVRNTVVSQPRRKANPHPNDGMDIDLSEAASEAVSAPAPATESERNLALKLESAAPSPMPLPDRELTPKPSSVDRDPTPKPEINLDPTPKPLLTESQSVPTAPIKPKRPPLIRPAYFPPMRFEVLFPRKLRAWEKKKRRKRRRHRHFDRCRQKRRRARMLKRKAEAKKLAKAEKAEAKLLRKARREAKLELDADSNMDVKPEVKQPKIKQAKEVKPPIVKPSKVKPLKVRSKPKPEARPACNPSVQPRPLRKALTVQEKRRRLAKKRWLRRPRKKKMKPKDTILDLYDYLKRHPLPRGPPEAGGPYIMPSPKDAANLLLVPFQEKTQGKPRVEAKPNLTANLKSKAKSQSKVKAMAKGNAKAKVTSKAKPEPKTKTKFKPVPARRKRKVGAGTVKAEVVQHRQEVFKRLAAEAEAEKGAECRVPEGPTWELGQAGLDRVEPPVRPVVKHSESHTKQDFVSVMKSEPLEALFSLATSLDPKAALLETSVDIRMASPVLGKKKVTFLEPLKEPPRTRKLAKPRKAKVEKIEKVNTAKNAKKPEKSKKVKTVKKVKAVKKVKTQSKPTLKSDADVPASRKARCATVRMEQPVEPDPLDDEAVEQMVAKDRRNWILAVRRKYFGTLEDIKREVKEKDEKERGKNVKDKGKKVTKKGKTGEKKVKAVKLPKDSRGDKIFGAAYLKPYRILLKMGKVNDPTYVPEHPWLYVPVSDKVPKGSEEDAKREAFYKSRREEKEAKKAKAAGKSVTSAPPKKTAVKKRGAKKSEAVGGAEPNQLDVLPPQWHLIQYVHEHGSVGPRLEGQWPNQGGVGFVGDGQYLAGVPTSNPPQLQPEYSFHATFVPSSAAPPGTWPLSIHAPTAATEEQQIIPPQRRRSVRLEKRKKEDQPVGQPLPKRARAQSAAKSVSAGPSVRPRQNAGKQTLQREQEVEAQMQGLVPDQYTLAYPPTGEDSSFPFNMPQTNPQAQPSGHIHFVPQSEGRGSSSATVVPVRRSHSKKSSPPRSATAVTFEEGQMLEPPFDPVALQALREEFEEALAVQKVFGQNTSFPSLGPHVQPPPVYPDYSTGPLQSQGYIPAHTVSAHSLQEEQHALELIRADHEEPSEFVEEPMFVERPVLAEGPPSEEQRALQLIIADHVDQGQAQLETLMKSFGIPGAPEQESFSQTLAGVQPEWAPNTSTSGEPWDTDGEVERREDGRELRNVSSALLENVSSLHYVVEPMASPFPRLISVDPRALTSDSFAGYEPPHTSAEDDYAAGYNPISGNLPAGIGLESQSECSFQRGYYSASESMHNLQAEFEARVFGDQLTQEDCYEHDFDIYVAMPATEEDEDHTQESVPVTADGNRSREAAPAVSGSTPSNSESSESVPTPLARNGESPAASSGVPRRGNTYEKP